jgi:cytochrome c553
MKYLIQLFLLLVLVISSVTSVFAASLYAGQSKAEAVCSQCHGIKKPAAEASFPSLAGRDSAYLRMALKQYRDKTRIAPIMNNIAVSLSDKDIANVAAYYARLKP